MRMEEGMYEYMLNGTIEAFDGEGFPIIQNEGSNIKCTGFPVGYNVVGFANIVEQNRIIWFLANPTTGDSEIGETQHFEDCRQNAKDGIIKGACDDCQSVNITEAMPLEKITQVGCCTYRTIRNQQCFNFDRRYPVNSVAYRILSCSLEIFFTDNNNGRRWLEFEYTDDDPSQSLTIKKDFLQITGFNTPPCEDPIYSTDIDCNKMEVQPNAGTPCIDFVDLVPGGSNKAGAYQFFVAYADVSGTKRTSYVSGTNPIDVSTRRLTFETDYTTDRAIALDINGLDLYGPFEYYNLAVAKTINGFTAFYLVGTFPITQHRVTYTGNDASEIKLEAGDIFQRVPYYKNASAVTSSNNILYWANPTEFPKLNLQRVANGINLQWQTIAIPEAVYINPRNINKYRSLMRDEVYPFGIVFIMDNMEETNAYHIPGRAAISSDLEIINNADVLSGNTCASGVANKRWQVYNTGTLEGGNLEIYKECEETCYQFGNFAYWESSERYPNIPEIWGELCGQQIRHPKTPDSFITHIHNREDVSISPSGGTYFENNLVFPLGVKVDHDSVRAAIAAAVTDGLFTQADANRIVGYRIVRGNRFGNKSIVAKGLFFDMNQYVRHNGDSAIDLHPIYFANYPYNDLRANPFITDQFKNYDTHNNPEGDDLAFTKTKRFTFHSPDTHFSEPTAGTELKLETSEYGESEGFYSLARQQAKQKLLSNSSYFLAMTGGIVAAMLRTEEKVCVEYTIKSDTIISQKNTTTKQDSYTVDSNWDVSGSSPYGNVSGTLDLGTGEISTMEASGSYSGTGDGSSDVPDVNSTITHGVITEHHHNHADGDSDNNLVASDYTWDVVSGAAGTAKQNDGTTAINNDKFEKIVAKTCRGTHNQYYNGLFAEQKPLLTAFQSIVNVLTQATDFLRIVLQETNIILDLIKSLSPYRDWSVQYNSVGKYNTYSAVPNNAGQKRRVISTYSYLKSENTIVNEPVNNLGQSTSIRINNWNRESSLYLKYEGTDLQDPDVVSGVEDQSRIKMDDSKVSCSLDKRAYSNICSYYGSMKNYVPDQYGTIYNIDYLPTDSCVFPMDASNSDCRGVYGGDTFINRFALKVKVPYWLATTFKLPTGTDWNYTLYPNLAFPRNYFDNTLTLGSELDNITDILNPVNFLTQLPTYLGRPKSIRDCDTNKFFYQNGYIYLYHYGIPYFLCESDVNVDLRTAQNTKEKDFYPHQGDLETWLQEETVPISEDNTYFYNSDYSKQNKETFIGIDGPKFEPSRDCRVEHPNRIIYATDANWLVYKANDFFDYPLSNGAITSIEGIENDTVLVRTINSTSVFKSVLRIPVDGQTVQTGNGGVFSNPPQEFAKTTLGYIGSQHKAILHTEYGHITVDAKRGQVFNISPGGNGAEDIGKDGMKNWFKENLPFKLLREFPKLTQADIDNNFNGLGIALSFDKRFNRFFLTKLDYKRKLKDIQYDPINKEFFRTVNAQRVVVSLQDKRYFTDCSWTAGYNFFTKSWVSFYSFKPNYYIDMIDFFSSGNDSGFWLHNLTNHSTQVFYGKLNPFVIEPLIKFQAPLSQLSSVEFDTEVRRYQNDYDYTLRKSIPGFNKTVVSNDIYSSGLLNLSKVDKNDLSLAGVYPIRNFDNWDTEIAIANYKWRFNQIYDLVRDNSEIPLWLYDGNNADKTLNPLAFNYKKDDFSLARMKGQWFKMRLINDKWSNYKILFKFGLDNKTILHK